MTITANAGAITMQDQVVDTAPPVITNLSFNRFDATLTVAFQDSLSGMDIQSITNSAFYHLSARPCRARSTYPGLIYHQIYYTPACSTDPVVVRVVFNNGHSFRGSKYTGPDQLGHRRPGHS